MAHVAADRVPRAVDEAEDRVRGERHREGLHRVVVGEAASVPAHGRIVLDDEHRGALDVPVDLAHEEGEHLGEVRALLDDGDRGLEAGVVGDRGGRGLLREHLRHGGADRRLVDLLVVARHRLAQLVERANERGLVSLDRALDLDDPVRHLLADQGGGSCFQVVFEAHVPLGGRAENEAVSRLTSPRIIRYANGGVNEYGPGPAVASPRPCAPVGYRRRAMVRSERDGAHADRSCASTDVCGRDTVTPAGGPASRRSRSASGPSWSRTPPGPTSSAPSSACAPGRSSPSTRSIASPRRDSRRSLRSSGTFRVKARRLRAFLDFLGAEYGGRVERMRRRAPRRPAPEAPRGVGHRSGDRRLDRPLRGRQAPLRRGRLHPARLLAGCGLLRARRRRGRPRGRRATKRCSAS